MENGLAPIQKKKEFLGSGKFNLGDGSQIHFWEDTWLGNTPLKYQYPSLFNITRKKHASVATVLGATPLNISFRRSLVGNNRIAWLDLVARVMSIQLSDRKDTFCLVANPTWLLHGTIYIQALVAPNIVPRKHILWKLKLPLRVKIFMWYLIKGVTLTRDNLARMRWQGSLKCSF